MAKWIVPMMKEWGCTNSKCPECKAEFFQPRILVGTMYEECPNCGAKMDGYEWRE